MSVVLYTAMFIAPIFSIPILPSSKSILMSIVMQK